MKKRSKFLIVVSAVLLILGVGAVGVLRQPAGTDYLEGAQLVSVNISEISSTGLSGTTVTDRVLVRRYVSPEQSSAVAADAARSLIERGYIVGAEEIGAVFVKGAYDSVFVQSLGAGSEIRVMRPAGALDRARAWFWDLTHQ